MSEILLVNPRRRRASKKRVTKKRRATRRRRNPVARKRVTRRRSPARAVRRRVRRKANPSFRMSAVRKQLMTATTGAVGALGLDIALAYIPLPANITGGMIGKITKAAGAIGLGLAANAVGVSAVNANRMAEGALTVQLHGMAKELMGQFAPGVALSGVGYYGSGWNPSAEFDNNSMGAYLPALTESHDNMGIGAYLNQQNAMGAYNEY